MAVFTERKRQPWHRVTEEGTEPPSLEAFRNMRCARYTDGEYSPGQRVDFSAILVRSGRHEIFPTELWEVVVFLLSLVSWGAVAGHGCCFPAVSVACSIWQSRNWDTASCRADVCVCWFWFWGEGQTKWVAEPCLAVSQIPQELGGQWA